MVATAQLPKLRTDLKVSAQQTSSGVVYVIKDPETNKFYRFGEAEEFITRQFDGETPLDAIQARVERQFGAALSPETLRAFAKNLERMNLLEGQGETAPKGTRGRRIQGSLLYLRFKILDPAPILDRLLPYVRMLYTPYFLILSALSILMAADILITGAADLVQSYKGMIGPSVVPLFFAFSLITVGLHEFAHGMTCRRYGGEVHEIGFLLVYFQPALYCNVSDAWLFPHKSWRMWVGFAGPYFELFLWSLAVFVWRIAEQGTMAADCALAVIAISGVKTLANFNPMIKLDGYYLLSDFLEIPNLRNKAFSAVSHLFRKRDPRDEQTSRERFIYVTYGLLAITGSTAILIAVFVAVLRQFGDGGASLVFVVPLLWGLGLRLKVYLSRLRRGKTSSAPPAASDEDEDSELATSRSEAAESGATEPGKKPNRALVYARRLAVLIMIGAAVIAIARRSAPLRVRGAFFVLPSTTTDVRASVDGLIDRILVREGQIVAAGDLIAVLSDRDLRANVERADAEIREAEAKLRRLQAGATGQEIALAEAGVAKAVSKAEFAQRKLERSKTLFNAGVLSRIAYDDADETAHAAQAELVEARAQLNTVLHSVRPEQVDEVRAEIERLEANRVLYRDQSAALRVTAPVSGVVGTPEHQLELMTHQMVRRGDPILKIYDSNKVRAQVLVSEKEIPAVEIGQDVELRARAHPLMPFHGKVNFISSNAVNPVAPLPGASSSATVQPGKAIQSVVIESVIDNRSHLLKPEMTGDARIDCGRRSFYELAKWHISRYLRVDSLSW